MSGEETEIKASTELVRRTANSRKSQKKRRTNTGGPPVSKTGQDFVHFLLESSCIFSEIVNQVAEQPRGFS